MILTIAELAVEAMKLPAELRLQLAEAILASVDDEEDVEVDREALDEAKRRYEELRSGVVQAESAEEFFAGLRPSRE